MVCLFLCQTNLQASSHREAPLISGDPQADNTDVYAFRSPCDDSKVVLIANYIPFEHPAGGPNWYTFGQNIRYEIHVKNKATTNADDITYRFTFARTNEDSTTFFDIRLGKENNKTTYTLEKSVNGGAFTVIVTNGKVPVTNIGPRSIENTTVGLGAANYDALVTSSIMTASGGNSAGEKVFAGPADDPFFVDLGGAFDLGAFRRPGRDGLNKMNVHSLCIEVPISSLQKDGRTTAQATTILDPDFVIGVWASASRPSITTRTAGNTEPGTSGNWVQVSRLGMPLTNEAINPIGVKDRWNATNPYNSANELYFVPYFKNPELALYMDDSQFGTAVPGLGDLRIQTHSLKTATDSGYDFRNGKKGLYRLKGNPALVGTALDPATYGNILLPDSMSPRAVDILPIFYTGVPNQAPYQLATGKSGNPLAAGKPFINNFLPTLNDMLRLNMAVPVTPRNSADFSSLGLVKAAVLGLTDSRFNGNTSIQNIPNMDGFPNGRRLEDDVTTIELQAVGGVVLAAIGLWYDDYTPGTTASPVTAQLGKVLNFNAGPTTNDTTFKPCFPYVQGPWRSFTGPSYAAAAPCGDPTNMLYVDDSVATSGSGSSWACAKKTLAEAIKIANNNPAIKSIWVADGKYTPGPNRSDLFVISRADLKIIGGFSGNETMESQANSELYQTVVTGDLGVQSVISDNSYNLFLLYKVPTNTNRLMFQKMIFEGANAVSPSFGNGAAVVGLDNSPTTPVMFQLCLFRYNTASASGGAIYLDNSNMAFDSCIFYRNQASAGAGVYSNQSQLTFNACLFWQNTATYGGGGVFGNNGTGTFNKSLFVENSAMYAGAMYQNAFNTTINNTVFTTNTGSAFGGGLYLHNSSNASMANSTFYNNATNGLGGGIMLDNDGSNYSLANSIFYMNKRAGSATTQYADVYYFGASTLVANTALQLNSGIPADNGTNIRNNVRGINPAFVSQDDWIGPDGKYFTADAGLRLTNSSPVRNIGSNALAPAGTDILGLARIACTTVDLGAYENQICTSFTGDPIVITGRALAAAVVNPFTSDLQIRYSGNVRATVVVMSSAGNIMARATTVAEGITHVNTSSWAPGLYQVQVITQSGDKSNFKVIKQQH